MTDETIVDRQPDAPPTAVTCPLCGEEVQSSQQYAGHLAESHGLVDDEGTETRIPEPEAEPMQAEPTQAEQAGDASEEPGDEDGGAPLAPPPSRWQRVTGWLTADRSRVSPPDAGDEPAVDPEPTGDRSWVSPPDAGDEPAVDPEPPIEPEVPQHRAEAPPPPAPSAPASTLQDRTEAPPVRTELVRDVQRSLEGLGLRGVAAVLPERLGEARSEGWTAEELLGRLCDDERRARADAAHGRRLREAGFPSDASFESFDFAFNPELPADRLCDLARLEFLDRGEAVILHGPAGVGKSHIAQAVGRVACAAGRRVRFEAAGTLLMELGEPGVPNERHRFATLARADLVVIDGFGMRGLSPAAAEGLHELVTERRGAGLLITSSRQPSDWLELFPVAEVGEAVLDQILHPSQLIEMPGRSHRAEGGAHRPR